MTADGQSHDHPLSNPYFQHCGWKNRMTEGNITNFFCEKSSFVNKIEWSVVNFRLSKSKISSLNIYVSSGHMSLFSFQFFLFTNRIFAIEPDSWGLLCSYLLNLQGSVLAMSSDYIFWDIVFTWHRRLAESANDQLLYYSDRQKQG